MATINVLGTNKNLSPLGGGRFAELSDRVDNLETEKEITDTDITNIKAQLGRLIPFTHITRSQSITRTGDQVLDAIENNGTVSTSLRYLVNQANNNCTHLANICFHNRGRVPKDFNDITDMGVYLHGGDMGFTNSPPGICYGLLLYFTSPPYRLQIFYTFNSHKIFARSAISETSAYSDWCSVQLS